MRGLVVLLLLVMLPAAAGAQENAGPPPVESTAHQHLGFFFRADIGVGYGAPRTTVAPGLTFSATFN
jgi:hypothetical protein